MTVSDDGAAIIRQPPSAGCLPSSLPETAHLLHAEAMERAGDLASAVAQYQYAIALNPGCFTAWNNLGNLFARLKDWPTARVFLQEAEALNPQCAAVKNNLANVLEKCGHPELSIEKYRAAISLEPEHAPFRNNLGNLLTRFDDWQGAEQMLSSAIGLCPGYAAAHVNLAYLRYQQGRLEQAEALYRHAIGLDPSNALAHTCMGQLLLRRGAFQEGWNEQEWRWQWEDFPSPRRNFAQPQWHGEDIRGMRIFLHAEQGFGDTLQFARYVPLVAALGAHVALEVHPELVTLMHSLAGVSHLIARGQPLPQFDVHCPLLSLPVAFATTLDTIPRATPYLQSDASTPPWLGEIEDSAPRVGLVWTGNPANRIQARRSLPFAELHPLFSTPGVKFYSFQRGDADHSPTEDTPFEAVLPESGDFSTTAAALCHMDLLITVDTAAAHLAGALGLPVWILLPYVSDWRWLKDEPTTPWYPTATLFRQTESQCWDSVIAEVRSALLVWTAKRSLSRFAMPEIMAK